MSSCLVDTYSLLIAWNARVAFGRARRGASGALYLQSAIAGLNSQLRSPAGKDLVVMDSGVFGTNAMQIYEPRQVRKEAAVSRPLHVPLVS